MTRAERAEHRQRARRRAHQVAADAVEDRIPWEHDLWVRAALTKLRDYHRTKANPPERTAPP